MPTQLNQFLIMKLKTGFNLYQLGLAMATTPRAGMSARSRAFFVFGPSAGSMRPAAGSKRGRFSVGTVVSGVSDLSFEGRVHQVEDFAQNGRRVPSLG